MLKHARHISFAILIVVACTTLFVWSLVRASEPPGVLTVAFIDVGQGDAIYIESPTGNQVLVDGGKNSAVLRGLGELISATDHSLDVVIATHPDMDHIGGLPEIFKRFEVGQFFESGVRDDGADQKALDDSVRNEGLIPGHGYPGTRLAIGGGAYIEFLFPESDAALFESNTGSIVVRAVYGDTAFMLTGDSPAAVEQHLARRYGPTLSSDVLKVGHHGSKTSSSEMFLSAVSPQYAVISAGCNNSYGHPHTEVLERLRTFKTAILETCKEGTVLFTSDGRNVVQRR